MLAHVYMTTTGRTPMSNIKAMVTGYKQIEPQDEEAGGSGKRVISA